MGSILGRMRLDLRKRVVSRIIRAAMMRPVIIRIGPCGPDPMTIGIGPMKMTMPVEGEGDPIISFAVPIVVITNPMMLSKRPIKMSLNPKAEGLSRDPLTVEHLSSSRCRRL